MFRCCPIGLSGVQFNERINARPKLQKTSEYQTPKFWSLVLRTAEIDSFQARGLQELLNEVKI